MSELRKRYLQWCNGGHYFHLDERSCPVSGAYEFGLAERLRDILATHCTYEDLIGAGIDEEDLLRLVIVPDTVATPDYERYLLTPCGGDASEELAALVTERNRLVLVHFPDGRLKDALRPREQKLVWYARRPKAGSTWTLVDKRYWRQWRQNTIYEKLDDAQIAQLLAQELATSVADVLRVSAGQPSHDCDVELSQFPAHFDHPYTTEDPWDPLSIANDRGELFTLTTYPLIPWGHLQFLDRFYLPLCSPRARLEPQSTETARIGTDKISTHQAIAFNVSADRAPVHPGEILAKDFLIPLGMSEREFADRTQLPPPHVKLLLRQRWHVHPNTALRLARLLGTTAEFWLNLQQAWDIHHELRSPNASDIAAIEPLKKAG